MNGFDFQLNVVWESVPMLLSGAKLTVIITVTGLIIGFAIGAFTGLLKISRNIVFRKTAGVYIEIIRGTPIMVQVMFIYFGLPMAINTRIPPLQPVLLP
jgi:glutamine transport system permease protein